MRKKKDRQQNLKRIVAAAIAILIALIMLLGLFAPMFTAAVPVYGQTSAITIDGRVGFNRMHKMFGYTPFNIQLTNEGGDFEGTLRIMVDVSTNQRERNFVSYAGDVFIEGGTTKELEMVIPLTSSRRTYRVVLTDTREQIVASRTLFASAVDSQLVMAGVLTDNRQAAARLRWLHVDTWSWTPGTSILNERLILLDESMIPSSANALSSFNLLIIDDFDLARLSDAQVDAIYEWTNSGGTLVASALFAPDFLHNLEGFDAIQAEMMYRLTSSRILPVEIAELTYVTPLGDGTVIIHNFSLMAEVIAQESTVAFLSDVYRVAINIDLGIGTGRNQILQLTTNLPLFAGTGLVFVFAIVGVYALIIGVVLYIVLKKRDRREFAVVVIPAAALLVAGVVAFIGFGSGYQDPITNTVTRLEFEGGSANANAVAATGVYWPTSGDITVNVANGAPIIFELSPQNNIMPLSASDSRVSGRIERDEAEIIAFGEGARSQITFFGRPSWSGGYFSQTMEVELEGSLHGEFVFEGNVLAGSILNDTGFDIYDLIVGVGTTFERFDFLANGDTIPIRKTIGNQTPHFSWWSVVESVFPFHGLGHNLTPEEGRDLQFRRDVLSNMISGGGGLARPAMVSGQTVSVGTPEARRFVPDIDDGNIYEPEQPAGPLTRHELGAPIVVSVMGYSFIDATGMAITVNGTQPTAIHTNFLITSFPMNLADSAEFDLPMGLLNASAIVTDVQLNFDNFSNSFSVSDAGFVEFIYDFGTGRIDYLAVEFDSFGVEAVILNHETGGWDGLEALRGEGTHYTYIYNGEMRVRIEFTAFSWINPPRVYVRGGN